MLRRWHAPGGMARRIELWITGDIVSKPPGGDAARGRRLALVNPANEGLSGCRNFPYFPRGGPVPSNAPRNDALRFATSWGGMDVGREMVSLGNPRHVRP